MRSPGRCASIASAGYATAPPSCSGEVVPEALLAYLAPLGWQHVNLTGDYLWGEGAGVGPDGFRALRAGRHALAAA